MEKSRKAAKNRAIDDGAHAKIRLMTDKPVAEVIASRMMARRKGVSAAEYKKDGARLCLAVEGSGMRGIVSLGMLLALRDLGMLGLFDSYVGVSAGGFNLSYVLAGQAAEAVSFYADDIAGKDLAGLMRFQFNERPMVDMHRLQNHMIHKRPLAVAKLSPMYATSLRLAVTNVSQNRGELIYVEKAGHGFADYLFAGSILPFIGGEPWLIGQEKYSEGNFYYIDPILAAEDIKASHMLVLYGRPQDKPVQGSGDAVQRRVDRLGKYSPGSGAHYLAALQAYTNFYGDLAFGETNFEETKIYRHALPHAIGVGRSTIDHIKLTAGLKAGYQSGLDLFCRTYRASLVPTMVAKR